MRSESRGSRLIFSSAITIKILLVATFSKKSIAIPTDTDIQDTFHFPLIDPMFVNESQYFSKHKKVAEYENNDIIK